MMRNQFGDIQNDNYDTNNCNFIVRAQCSGGGEPTPSKPAITKVETKYDTITIDKKVYVPKVENQNSYTKLIPFSKYSNRYFRSSKRLLR